MVNELDTRFQLACAIKASKQVYLNWIRNYTGGTAHVYSNKNYSLHLNAGHLLVYIWRESRKHPLASLEVVAKGRDNLIIYVENYFRGIARDTLELNPYGATLEDYMNLANNFPEKAVEQILQGLSEGFEQFGLADEYAYQLNCVK